MFLERPFINLSHLLTFFFFNFCWWAFKTLTSSGQGQHIATEMPPQWNTMGLPHLGWWIWSQSQPVAKKESPWVHCCVTLELSWTDENWELAFLWSWKCYWNFQICKYLQCKCIGKLDSGLSKARIYIFVCVCVCVCLCACISFRASYIICGFGLGTKWTCQSLLFKKQDKSDTENTKTDIFLHSFPHTICYLTLFYIKKNFKLSTWILLFTFILCDASFMCKYTHIWAFLGLRQ